MSEKKYYVFLSPLNNGNKPFFQLVSFGFMAELVGFAKCNTKNKNGRYENKYSKFTKSELDEIMGGAILKRIPGGTPLDELGKDKSCYVWLDDCNYWKNPLIDLVPVEDGE
ncbi:hypothetical protein P7H79_00535 [Lactococcus lactis]|uniref:hypothetical protein n=1 Tax=Lactococcus lactis TaxID=1358 RepID=UPI002891BB5E|nr:hypothetical protein [Lactococcus lactis]MDT2871868.1 hypothetical protein [Lactococcus lactis]MDT2934090.1 hypothetical protein [Lactococcus lactis]